MKYNRELHTPYSTVLFQMILSDHEWLSKNIQWHEAPRGLCDSWASCTLYKLRYRRETARCFMSLNISLSHSRSFEMKLLSWLGMCKSILVFRWNYGCMVLYHIKIKRDIDRKSRFFDTPLQSTPPVGGSWSEYCHNVWCGETRMVWLPDSLKSLIHV